MDRLARRIAALALCCTSLIVVTPHAHAAIDDHTRAERAMSFVASMQTDAGAFPAFSPVGSTADAVLSFVATGKGETPIHDAVGFLRRQTKKGKVDTVGLRAKVSLAVEAVGLDAGDFGGHSLLGEISETQRLTGRFGKATVFDQALAVLAITAATDGYNLDAIGWLLRAQCPDGGWQFDRPWREGVEGRHCADTSDPTDSFASDTNTTAYVLMAIDPSGKGTYDHDPFAFLAQIRDDSGGTTDGGWGYTWGLTRTDANSTALVIQAYVAAGESLPSGALGALRRLQYGCGSFAFTWTDAGTRTGPDLGSTIGAALGLLRAPLPVSGEVVGELPPTTC